jgi:polyhydroxybutyrate depolymerase
VIARAALLVLLASSIGAAKESRQYDLINASVPRPAPLMVALQCYGCPTSFLPERLGLEALARKHGVVVAVPSANIDSRGSPFWNATDACCDFDGRKPDDVGYVLGVIRELVARGVADPKRVYLVGFSNGGFLAHRIACDHASEIAAIVSIGAGGPSVCKPSTPVSILEVHGNGDTVVPSAGGRLGRGLPNVGTFPSLRAALDAWATVDGCGAPDAGGRRACTRGAIELWSLPGDHWPDVGADFGERVWGWLAARHH